MKKIALKLTLSLAVVAAAGYMFHLTKAKKPTLTGVALDNVEALALEEVGGGYCTLHIRCYDQYGTPTGKYRATSFQGPNCNGPQHEHGCTDCSSIS